jgi:hypothetical protein
MHWMDIVCLWVGRVFVLSTGLCALWAVLLFAGVFLTDRIVKFFRLTELVWRVVRQAHRDRRNKENQ